VRSIKDLIALAKARPGQLNFSSAGVGNAGHFAGELFKALANAVFAPAATPKEIIGRLNAEILKALAAPEVRERLPGVGGAVPSGGSPEELGAFFRSEVEKFGKTVRGTGLKIQ